MLSGGGARAAYQIGALKALAPYLSKSNHQIKVVVGSSIGAINGLLVSACLSEGIDHAVSTIEQIWLDRTYKNTFNGSPSMAFIKAIRLAVIQVLSPGPKADPQSLFDPDPLMAEVDRVIKEHGGLLPENRLPTLESVAVMTTVEGETRQPLLFVSSHRELTEPAMRGASFDTAMLMTFMLSMALLQRPCHLYCPQ